jgi:adenylate cyclase
VSADGPALLVVDDNEDNRYTLTRRLTREGYTNLTTATNGREALDLLQAKSFHLVLLDMMMPGMNGDEVLKAIKDNPETRDIPVVMISADTDIEKVAQCIEVGADDYLPKPFNPTILRARVSAALRRSSLRALENEYLARVEQEKRRSESLLRNVLPPDIAVRLGNGAKDIADYFEEATVIFADVVGFGRITAKMKPYEIVGCLNRLFSEFDKVAEDVGVERIKTIGDNYMTVVGVPTARSGHARVAVKLALDLVAASERLRLQLPIPFPIRVGVHTGPVMAGVIGTRRLAYDVWGDTVNMAARVEGASKAGCVLVSSTTAEAAGSEYQFDGPHKIETKEQRTIESFFVSRRA